MLRFHAKRNKALRARLGPAWIERRRPPEGYYTKRKAQVALDGQRIVSLSMQSDRSGAGGEMARFSSKALQAEQVWEALTQRPDV
jgi:hypothetical protein